MGPKAFAKVLLGAGILAATGTGCGAAGQSVRSDETTDSAGADGLTWKEQEGLKFTREEEKLARDVYAVLEVHDRSFGNIGQSEQSHMDAVGTLLTRYGIQDPAFGKAAGDFANTDLQALYDALVDQGSSSRMAALSVAIEIEELDIHDIEDLAAEVTHPDILTVYRNLTRGSRNHLRTFYGKLVSAGGTYNPKHIEPETFDSIVASPMERGPSAASQPASF